MKKFYLFTFLSALCISVNAQLTAGFDDLSLPEESYWNGADGSGGFTSGDFIFSNTFNASWGSWSGFSYSNKTDVATPGYGNQYSAITGMGHLGSGNYAVAYCFGTVKAALPNASTLKGLYVTNSTYTYLSLLNGDEFGYSKKIWGNSWH